MDTRIWVEPISADSPCGESLEYSAEFLKLQELATGLPERQYGQVVIPAEGPDWSAVFDTGDKLLRLSKDMRIVSILARSAIWVNGLAGFAQMMDVADQLADRYWDTLHPTLEFDGQSDPIMRVNAITELSAPEGLLRDLRSAVFVQGRGLVISVRQAERALSPSDRQISGDGISREQLLALTTDALRIDSSAFDPLERAHQSAVRLQRRCVEKLSLAVAPDLGPLVSVLATLSTSVSQARQSLLPSPSFESASNNIGGDFLREFDFQLQLLVLGQRFDRAEHTVHYIFDRVIGERQR